ncbi:MAG: hypothetical protein ABW185_21815 [Sedimenticola sp.]
MFLITPEAQLLILWVEHNEPEANRGENHGKKSGSISERYQFATIFAAVSDLLI